MYKYGLPIILHKLQRLHWYWHWPHTCNSQRCIFMGNGYSWRGDTSVKSFDLPCQQGSTFQRRTKELSPKEQIPSYSFRINLYSWRESQECHLLLKEMVKNVPSLSIPPIVLFNGQAPVYTQPVLFIKQWTLKNIGKSCTNSWWTCHYRAPIASYLLVLLGFLLRNQISFYIQDMVWVSRFNSTVSHKER